MNTHKFQPFLTVMMLLAAMSTFGEERPHTASSVTNPITMESQIRDITVKSDDVLIHLIREPYDIIAPVWLRVRSTDGPRMYARDLLKDDNVRIEGDLDHNTVSAVHITLQLRIAHR